MPQGFNSQSLPSLATSSGKAIPHKSQNSATKWGPRVQMHEPLEDVLPQTTPGIMYNPHQYDDALWLIAELTCLYPHHPKRWIVLRCYDGCTLDYGKAPALFSSCGTTISYVMCCWPNYSCARHAWKMQWSWLGYIQTVCLHFLATLTQNLKLKWQFGGLYKLLPKLTFWNSHT